jgi:hypothetical protein
MPKAANLSTVLVDEDNPADQWWAAAKAATDCPAALRPIIHGGKRELRMPKAVADACEAWCAKLPGWADGPDHEGNALIIVDAE